LQGWIPIKGSLLAGRCGKASRLGVTVLSLLLATFGGAPAASEEFGEPSLSGLAEDIAAESGALTDAAWIDRFAARLISQWALEISCGPPIAEQLARRIYEAGPDRNAVLTIVDREWARARSQFVEALPANYDPAAMRAFSIATATTLDEIDVGGGEGGNALRLAYFQDQFWRRWRFAADGRLPVDSAAGGIAEIVFLLNLCKVQQENVAWMRGQFERHFEPDNFEDRTATASFIIALHADHFPDFQLEVAQYLASINLPEDHEQDRLAMIARLVDRRLVNLGEPQLYGTLWSCHSDDAHPRNGIADPGALDDRRASMGLMPLAQIEQQHSDWCGRMQAEESAIEARFQWSE
jgi:hypothetical protein